jgi:ribonuclease Z
LADFTANFDPHMSGTKWLPIDADDEVKIRDNLVVRAIENSHVPTDGKQIKSLTYIVQSISRKLKPKFAGRKGTEIAAISKKLGADAITDESRSTELIYSGDTPVESDGRYDGANILIHEATFLTREEIQPDNPKRNKHSSLDAVMEMVKDSEIEALILGHFSSRYSNEQIDDAIDREIARCGIKIPVKRVYPGLIARDI